MDILILWQDSGKWNACFLHFAECPRPSIMCNLLTHSGVLFLHATLLMSTLVALRVVRDLLNPTCVKSVKSPQKTVTIHCQSDHLRLPMLSKKLSKNIVKCWIAAGSSKKTDE